MDAYATSPSGASDRLRLATSADIWHLECRMAAAWAGCGQPWADLATAKGQVADVAESLVLAALGPVMHWARTDYPHLFEQ